MRNKVRNMLLCFPQLRRYFDEGERAEDCFPSCCDEDKERNENVDAPAKKERSQPTVSGCIAEQFSTSCRVPAHGKPT